MFNLETKVIRNFTSNIFVPYTFLRAGRYFILTYGDKLLKLGLTGQFKWSPHCRPSHFSFLGTFLRVSKKISRGSGRGEAAEGCADSRTK